ncbi:bifunctional diaminohydroxyphosphoribosylaminopyrimidine deaminase/5-amino-6-(5-phosphoribosylamino)uracil reductase RibD [Rhodospirillum sp. A1_3_36]|uniref:bifunctional diaminohydroxyphosphoribosylaminopyrimidine deaminase/5-amino-6-(5-phosphoribosylamino)uracil reductase RibD n=1 Tax=Rhodospirillum sp. A1_3_36 TaxID=3391666 RepID=UPI0039A777B1
MGVALGLAARGLGRVWPNPSVGCVLVSPDGRVVGRGWTQPGGRPHAEREALDQAGPLARGATAHVTLEPCSHYGQTPPCADALIDAGVFRVVVALIDPDERVSGQGLARLRAAGIEVRTGVREAEARDLNQGFLLCRIKGRPLVTLKTATSLDGRIATATGHSQWITGPEARQRGHRLRATHDAIAVGVGTVLADDPTLTCRLPGLEDRSPVRVVFDSHARIPVNGALVRSADRIPLWVVTGPEASVHRRSNLEKKGARVLSVAGDDVGRPRVDAALSALADQGVTRLLVEGGGDLAGAFLAAGLVDHLVWFRAPLVIGSDGKGAIAAFGVDHLGDSAQFSARARCVAGGDLVEHFAASAPLSPIEFSLSETE